MAATAVLGVRSVRRGQPRCRGHHPPVPPRPAAGGTGHSRGSFRLGCAALLILIGYIHLHLWQEGYRQIATDGPLFLLDAVAAFVLAAASDSLTIVTKTEYSEYREGVP